MEPVLWPHTKNFKCIVSICKDMMHLFFERTPERKKETLFNLVHKNKIFQCCEAVVGEVPSCSCEVLFNLKK